MKLWQHQLEAIEFAQDKPASYIAADMGLGKSLITIELLRRWNAYPALIICPVAVMGSWREQFRKWGDGEKVLVLDSKNKTAKQKAIAAENHVAVHKSQAVVVVNYETAWRSAFSEWTIKRGWRAVVLDEAHRCKNSTAKITRYVTKLRKVCGRKLCLSGTPMPHSPLDAFSQVRFLNPDIFGWSWVAFRRRYAVMKQIPGVAVPIVDGYQNLDELEEKFSQVAFRVEDSVLELPEQIHSTVPIRLSSTAQRIYDDLDKEFVADVEAGYVTASNALVKLLRLQQITSGCVPTEDPGGMDLGLKRIDTSKMDALEELCADLKREEPVVVFCRFRSDLAAVESVAGKLKRPYTEISGSRKDLDNGKLTELKGQLCGAQIQAAGLGIDLTQARYCVFLSLGYSLGEYQQALKRLHRPGQKRSVFYYHLIAKGTVDEQVYSALEKRQSVIDSILQCIKQRHSTQREGTSCQ